MEIENYVLLEGKIDKQGDLFTKESLENVKIDSQYLFYNFNRNLLIGNILNHKYVNGKGLKIKVKITDEKIRQKIMNGYEIAFAISGCVNEVEEKGDIRIIKKLNVFSISLINKDLSVLVDD